MKSEINSAALIPQAALLAVCGDVSAMTLWRWRYDPESGFSRARTIRGRLYWREQEVIAWLNAREIADASAPSKCERRPCPSAAAEMETIKPPTNSNATLIS